MEIALAIVISSLIISLTLLYINTRNEWNWGGCLNSMLERIRNIYAKEVTTKDDWIWSGGIGAVLGRIRTIILVILIVLALAGAIIFMINQNDMSVIKDRNSIFDLAP